MCAEMDTVCVIILVLHWSDTDQDHTEDYDKTVIVVAQCQPMAGGQMYQQIPEKFNPSNFILNSLITMN